MKNFSRLRVVFFKTEFGREPVREWLKAMPQEARKIIGEEIKTVQFGWPLGMPLVRKMEPDLWEVRVHLQDRIARIFFTVEQNIIVLLHGFIKKGQKTSRKDLDMARRRLGQLKGQSRHTEVPNHE